MKTIDKINKIENQRKNLIKKISDVENILSGSYNIVTRKCGKLNCWCNDASIGHEYSRYIWRDRVTKATRTKAIHEDEKEWIVYCTSNYKELRKMLAELESLNNSLLKVINEMIVQKMEKTEKMKNSALSSVNGLQNG
jgi:hypothetical protein